MIRTERQTEIATPRAPVGAKNRFLKKEVIEPYVKVLLNVRDPVRWYESVRGSILALHITMGSWPCNWFNALMGSNMVNTMMDHKGMVPTSSSAGRQYQG